MSLPVVANNTCDVYRTGNAPPAAPDVATVVCNLKAYYKGGLERGESDGVTKHFSHIMLIDFASDVRDAWDVDTIGNADTVYVPDKNGVGYKVVYVEFLFEGLPGRHKKVYLSRKAPTWPSNNV